MFDGCLSVRPHLLLLNKADLVPHDSDVIRQLQANERNLQKIIYTDCKAHADHSIMNEVSTMHGCIAACPFMAHK